MVLDNIAAYAALDSTMDDYISDVNDPEGTYAGDSSTLLYTVTFEFDIEIQEPESEYEEPDNTNPYLLPVPVDQTIEIGAERVDYFLGEIMDNEAVNQTITITVDIEDRAQAFVEWRQSSNELIMRGEQADVNDLGQYDITIVVEDNFATAEIEGYVECEDREFATEALADACEERVNGIWQYDITITVVEPAADDDVVVVPEAAEIIEIYDGRVYDLGNTTLEDVYSYATGDIEDIDAATLAEALEIDKIELIDLAAAQDNPGVDLEEIREERDEEQAAEIDEYLNDDGPPLPTV